MASGHRRRVIEKVFKNGIESLYEHEFLELCLFSVYKRCDTNPLAHALLNKFGSLDAVCSASKEELMKVEGIGPAAAEYIQLIPYISKGYSIHTTIRKNRIYSTRESIYRRCIALLKGEKREVVYVLCFDSMRHLIKEVKIAEGIANSVVIEPRKVMDAIAQTTTTSIMICHNHPSGIRTPSPNDFVTTGNIKKLVNSVGIELIDHIVVVDNEYVSCVVLE